MKKKQSVSFWAGAIMAASIAAICIISFFWMPADPEKMDTLNRFALPSAAHLLGTDQFGRDVLSRIMEASRWALLVGVCSVTVGALAGSIIGASAAMLNRVGLPDSTLGKYPSELSGGQCQRIAIARALLLSPEVIICDECVSALDVSIQAQILNLLKDLQKEFSTAYLFISHDIGVIHYMSDFIVVINRGRIVEQGEGSQLIRTPKDDYTKRLIASSCSTGEGCVCGVR